MPAARRRFPAFASVCLHCLILSTALTNVSAEDWPQWRGPNRDGVWSETGIVKRFDSPKLEAVWRTPISAGYSGPTVADGRVFISDRVTKPQQQERIICLSESTGEQLWQVAYDCRYTISYTAGPRACITIDGQHAYALGAMGHLHCLDVETGAIVWKRDLESELKVDLPIWGIAAAPLIYKDLLILQIGGDGACVAALDRKTGETEWTALDDRAGYSAPVLTRQGDHDVVAVWTGDSVSGLAPASGEVYWRVPFPSRRMPIGIATPIIHKQDLFVTSFYDGSLMIRLSTDGDGKPNATKQWHKVGKSEKDTLALQSIISTPIRLGDHIYGVDSYGELRCITAVDGTRIWEDLTAVPKVRWGTIHFVQNGDRTFMFNELGELLIGKLSPKGFEEIDRTKLISPTKPQLPRRDGVCWSHPAFANGHVFVRNDEEIACFRLSEGN